MDITGGEIYQRRAAVLVMIETMQMRVIMMRMSLDATLAEKGIQQSTKFCRIALLWLQTVNFKNYSNLVTLRPT